MTKRILIRGLAGLARAAFGNWNGKQAIDELSGRKPKGILLANLGHLGDLILSTSVLPVLAENFPNARIGIVVGSWGVPLLKGHPLIHHIHVFDHWRQNRKQISLVQKLRAHITTEKQAIGEIREATYDLAIDLRGFFPSAAILLWKAGVPVRIGYDRLPSAAALTTKVRYRETGKHEVDYQLALLQALNIDAGSSRLAKQSVQVDRARGETEVSRLFETAGFRPGFYRVVHIGSGCPEREWQAANWRLLAEALAKEGNTLVFTGQGRREREVVESVIRGIPRCINACGQLSWAGYVEVVRRATILYGVESLSAHLASVFDIPVVSIYSGIGGVSRWGPTGKRAVTLTYPVKCAPCGLRTGCTEMTCVRRVTTQQVFAAGEALLKAH